MPKDDFYKSMFFYYALPRLSEERLRRGITAEEMCKRVPGLDEQSLRLVEAGRRHVGPVWRKRIAAALRLSTGELFREFSEEEVEALRQRTENGS
jgi:DNA-binding XRE family transcriptional regulator